MLLNKGNQTSFPGYQPASVISITCGAGGDFWWQTPAANLLKIVFHLAKYDFLYAIVNLKNLTSLSNTWHGLKMQTISYKKNCNTGTWDTCNYKKIKYSYK